jgi:hypothetical protein
MMRRDAINDLTLNVMPNTYRIRRLHLSRLLLGQEPRHPSARIINNVDLG